MKYTIYLSTIALLTVSAVACNDDKRAKNYNETLADDHAITFIKQGVEAGLTEVKAGTVAQAKSKNPRVINFAKMMVADHTAMGKELKGIANDKYVPTKDASDTLSVEHQQMVNGLSKLSGPAFDKAYMGMMVADHGKVVELFRVGTKGRNKAVNDFAEKSIPKLLIHLDSAKAINASLK
jgi:putative membrane protein